MINAEIASQSAGASMLMLRTYRHLQVLEKETAPLPL